MGIEEEGVGGTEEWGMYGKRGKNKRGDRTAVGGVRTSTSTSTPDSNWALYLVSDIFLSLVFLLSGISRRYLFQRVNQAIEDASSVSPTPNWPIIRHVRDGKAPCGNAGIEHSVRNGIEVRRREGVCL